MADVISELCELLGIVEPIEQQEFSLYCIVEGDSSTLPLATDEYILDVTTELLKTGQQFYLIFCRAIWHFPLKQKPAPKPLYNEVLFYQVVPDYLEGLLLELPGGGAPAPKVVRDMARIAALLHRAANLKHVPTMKEIKFLLPKTALGIRELRPPHWVALVQAAWPSIATLDVAQVKAEFLHIMTFWALYGSSFFAVRKVWTKDNLLEDSNPTWKEIILALNRRGVLFLHPNTHEPLQHLPFVEVISTRKVSGRNRHSLTTKGQYDFSFTDSFRRWITLLGYESGQFDATTGHSCSNGASTRNLTPHSAIHRNGTAQTSRTSGIDNESMRWA